MPRLAPLLLIFTLIFSAVGAVSQTTHRRPSTRSTQPAPAAPEASPKPESSPVTVGQPPAPKPLAIVNGQTLTTADIDPKAAKAMETLDEQIVEARKTVVELQTNTVLLQVEARKRKLTTHQLYEQEVVRRITDPTESEIAKFMEDNRDQLTEGDPASIHAQVLNFLRGEREAKLSAEFVKKLRTTNPVVMGVDINTPNLSDSVAVTTVSGEPVTIGVVKERLKPMIYKLQSNAYQAAKDALERTIKDVLLLAEARRRGIQPEEIVRAEVSDKIHPPTEAEVAKFYAENKARISGELDGARNQIASYLQDQEQQRLEHALSDRLQKGADIRLLISEPEPPVQTISTDDDPSRGDPNAPVTIVEFTDFQCPACAAMQPILEEVLTSYGNKVRFVVRDFPLSMHANALKAAEAANAANAQGKFFEYVSLLFKRQKALDIASLKKYASELGLSRSRFDTALDNGTYAAEVKHDIDDGEKYGVESTPTIFINGVMLKVLSTEGLRAAIDRVLAAPAASQKASTK